MAPAGTVAVIFVSEFTEKTATLPPPKVTLLACVRLFPVIVTCVPTGPLDGLKLSTVGVTRNFRLLFKLPPGVTTFTKPVPAPDGTVAEMYVSDRTLYVALVPLKVTLVAPVKPLPKMPTDLATFPEVGNSLTKALRPTSKLKRAPTLFAPPEFAWP